MPKRGKGGRKGPVVPVYDSDDERAYTNEKVPDPSSNDYFLDEVDKFHADREKILLQPDDGGEEDAMDTDEDDVLGLSDSDSDTEEIKMYKSQLQKFKRKKKKEDMGSDIEEEEEEKGLPDSKAWGGKRNKYYGADIDEDIDLSGSDDDETAALLEEKEALALQKKMAELLDDQDFGLDIFQPSKKPEAPGKEDEKIVKDLSKLTRKEKLQLLKKESPELLTLIDDFKDKLTEVRDRLAPLRTLIQDKGVTGKAAEYVHTKFRLNLNYCINIAFYLMLKAKQVPVHNHPVIKRLLQYRNLMKQLEPVDQQLEGEITDILTRLNAGEDVKFTARTDTAKTDSFVRRQKISSKKAAVDSRKLSELLPDSDSESDEMYEDIPTGGAGGAKKKKKLKDNRSEGRYETKDEKAALEYYNMMKDGRTHGQEEEGEGDNISGEENAEDVELGDLDMEDDGADPEGKRAISYQIQKNKGLTAQKKKELRNPRVKHRMKFRKAKIRRKGQVREARTEIHKYGGEISGIRAGIKRGIKLK